MKAFLLLCLLRATSAWNSLCPCKQYPDITNGLITGSNYSATYGASCAAHDAASNSECAGDDAPAWCTANWCYVDDDCALADLSHSLYFAQPISYSYQNCGHIDTFSAYECAKKSEQECGSADACQYNGGVCQYAKCLCIGSTSAFKPSHFGDNYGGSCAEHDKGVCHANYCGNPKGSTGDWCCDSWCFVDQATCPFAVQHPVNLEHFMAYGAACPQAVKEAGSCVEDTSASCDMSKNQACECRSIAEYANGEGKLVGSSGNEYNATYGASCDAWDKNSAVCQGSEKPDYCRSKWCYVDESCDAFKDVATSDYFKDVVSGGLHFSYSNCGSQNTYEAYACAKHTDEASCTSHDTAGECGWSPSGMCQWDKCMCIGEAAAGGTDGATCAPHRYNSGNCDVMYDTLKAGGQMFLDKANWCCKEFCYVNISTCPGARMSKEATTLAVSIGGVACVKNYDHLGECVAGVNAESAESETTCGEIRAAYKSSGCCGVPSKAFAFPKDRRMEAISGTASLKNAMPTGDLVANTLDEA